MGPIGGITHKMFAAKDAGATVFLVPAANCAEAKTDGGQGLTLVKVGTLTEAVDGLNALNRGEQPPSC
ncbi:PDZ/DHR/GLGF [Mycobacteroides abscessus subsp. abscessus]|nr:PDZ/DHR/GLGF [Mycobacteroides abscessus subsp. abscessus]